MDTKTLVVGQEVRVKGTVCYGPGKVVEVTPQGVVVQAKLMIGGLWEEPLLRFDKDGKDGEDRFDCLPIFDIKTLVVGQELWMGSGCYSTYGRVVKVTSKGLEVQEGSYQADGTYKGWRPYPLMHFDSEGNGPDSEGTHECGPWYIYEIVEPSMTAGALQPDQTLRLPTATAPPTQHYGWPFLCCALLSATCLASGESGAASFFLMLLLLLRLKNLYPLWWI